MSSHRQLRIHNTHQNKGRNFHALIWVQTRDPTKKPMQTYTLNQSATEIGVTNMEFFHCFCADWRM